MPRLVEEDGYPASHFIVPTDIFSGVVPNLNCLELTNISIRADSPLLLANLTELNLGRSSRTSCPRSFSLPVLIDILRRMPRMQILAADDILTEPTDASSLEGYLARVPKVFLPDLVYLRIHSPFLLNYRGLLRQLELKDPSRLCLDISTSIDSFEALDEPLLPRYIASADISSPPVRALSIQSYARQTFTLSGWRTAVHTL
ncbi:hypothetical protein EWM64_g8563 [Hericium alpestre]|uniref:F-box domain-containing protein n=1 Tax=Hericium alpestre TaxID=135208 RepID=A0A4Y9ZPT8_9AGAM|nr:hypothetical protein EWM64_g8563 [Hericium alpestre]